MRLAMFLLFSETCVAAGQWGGGAVVSINSSVRTRIHVFWKQPHHFYNLSHPFLTPLIPPLKKYDC